MTSRLDNSGSTAFFLTPGWIGLDDHKDMTLIDSRDGVSLTLSGKLRESFHKNELLAQPSFQALAEMNPMMARLGHSLAGAQPVPLNRSVLLKGAGWSRLFIELTGQCNENCLHCYAEASPAVTDALTESQVLAALADASELGFTSVQLTGGDPLISKTCLTAATRARELDFPLVEVYTNGLALKGKLFEDLASLDVAFAFSVYGQDALVHDVVTRIPGSHRLTMEAIDRAVSAGLRVRVGIINTGTTGFDLQRTWDLMISLGVSEDAIRWDVEREVGRGSFTAPAVLHEPDTSALPAFSADQMADAFAGTAAISYRGEVYPCIFTRNRPLGDINIDSLKDILERPDQVQFDIGTLDDDLNACADSLTCWRCRMRSTLLPGGRP